MKSKKDGESIYRYCVKKLEGFHSTEQRRAWFLDLSDDSQNAIIDSFVGRDEKDIGRLAFLAHTLVTGKMRRWNHRNKNIRIAK